jgi:hypothetical protein
LMWCVLRVGTHPQDDFSMSPAGEWPAGDWHLLGAFAFIQTSSSIAIPLSRVMVERMLAVECQPEVISQ